MKKIPLRLLKTTEGDYIASSSESVGFFALGDTRAEALQNARDGLSMLLNLGGDFAFDIEEVLEKPADKNRTPED
jgi:predicted RNase H-like HicB family nuclease